MFRQKRVRGHDGNSQKCDGDDHAEHQCADGQEGRVRQRHRDERAVRDQLRGDVPSKLWLQHDGDVDGCREHRIDLCRLERERVFGHGRVCGHDGRGQEREGDISEK